MQDNLNDQVEDEESKDDFTRRQLSIRQMSLTLFKVHHPKSSFIIQPRLQCMCVQGLKAYENCPNSLQLISYAYRTSKLSDLKNDYEKLLSYELPEIQARQIERDLNRTHPLHAFFSKDGDGVQQLSRVLKCIAIYDPSVGYVQGMNFIVAGLLYHSEEYIAFWNFINVYEILEFRDIYTAKLPGVSKHIQILKLLTMSRMRKLSTHFINVNQKKKIINFKNNISYEIFCAPLLFSLMAMVIPIQDYLSFFRKIMKNGWMSFYQVVLCYLEQQQDHLLSLEGPELIFEISSNQKMQGDENQDFFNRWNIIISQSDKVQINKQFISQMLDSYIEEGQIFNSMQICKKKK